MKHPVNVLVLRLFAPILILVAMLGFVLPPSLAMTSGAPAYNLFHFTFGLVGLGMLMSGKLHFVKAFNFGFGLIDLYQAVASFADLWPKSLFLWKRADDVLHVVIGAALVGVAVLADRAIAQSPRPAP